MRASGAERLICLFFSAELAPDCATLVTTRNSPVARFGVDKRSSAKPRHVVGQRLHLQIAKRVDHLRHSGGSDLGARARFEIAQRLVKVVLTLAGEAADIVDPLVVVTMAIGT